jgi:hypothetical protein
MTHRVRHNYLTDRDFGAIRELEVSDYWKIVIIVNKLYCAC